MVQLEADEAGDEGVHDFVLQVLQQHRELRNAAKGICDLARSHNPLTKHYQRYLDQADQAVSTTGPVGLLHSTPTSRVEKRHRKWLGSKASKRQSDRSQILPQTDAHEDPQQCSSQVLERPRTQSSDELQPDVQQNQQKSRARSKERRCIYCDKLFATKGNLRKHLENQHVSKTFQRCDGCREISLSVPRAVNHSKICEARVTHGATVSFHKAKDERRVYGSEFTGEFFSDQRKYVDHLLKQSEKLDGSALPPPCKRSKFLALLGQPAISVEIQAICNILFRTPLILEALEWENDDMENAIAILELGIVDAEPGPREALRRSMILPFLERLMLAGRPIHVNAVPDAFTQAKLGKTEPVNSSHSVPVTQQHSGARMTETDQHSMQLQNSTNDQDSWPPLQMNEATNHGTFFSDPQGASVDSQYPLASFSNPTSDDFGNEAATEATYSLPDTTNGQFGRNTIQSSHEGDIYSGLDFLWSRDNALEYTTAPWLP